MVAGMIADMVGGMIALHKVTAFVTSGKGATQMLLTIDHPDAGWQLPAGTVEVGEEPDTAVHRELQEEANLTDVTLVQKFATFSQLIGEQQVMTQTVRLQNAPEAFASGQDHICHRGWIVRELARQDSWVQVCYEEFEHHGNRPGKVLLSWAGWVADTAVTTTLTRHLYHFRPTTLLLDEWFTDPGDHGHAPWRLFWQPLRTAELVQSQHTWLEMVREKLVIGDP